MNTKSIIAIPLATIMFSCCEEKPIKEYYLIRYTPPVEQIGTYYSGMSDPECKIHHLKYDNDSTAIVLETKEYKRYMDGIMKRFNSEIDKPSPKGMTATMKAEATLNALLQMIAEERTIMVIEHDKSFDEKKFIKIIKKHGYISDEVQEYIDENNVYVDFHGLTYLPED